MTSVDTLTSVLSTCVCLLMMSPAPASPGHKHSCVLHHIVEQAGCAGHLAWTHMLMPCMPNVWMSFAGTDVCSHKGGFWAGVAHSSPCYLNHGGGLSALQGCCQHHTVCSPAQAEIQGMALRSPRLWLQTDCANIMLCFIMLQKLCIGLCHSLDASCPRSQKLLVVTIGIATGFRCVWMTCMTP